MSSISNTISMLKGDRIKTLFKTLYGQDDKLVVSQIDRYIESIHTYEKLFGDSISDVYLFSTPGRTEVGGNHTDHNSGRVLAAGVNLDSIAIASKTDDEKITIYSRGYDAPFVVDLKYLDPIDEEKGVTTALMRGICAKFKELGFDIGGFNVFINSDVLPGSGLSSSASIEVLLGTILSHFYNDGKVDLQQLAIIGRYAENIYFGKPCGLMDQMACAIGGFVTIDFKDQQNPIVEKVDFDFASQGYNLLVVDTGGNHADLTEDYAAVPSEMRSVAEALGGHVCREISAEKVIENIPMLRNKVGDRAILRAMHFFADDFRVQEQVKALKDKNFTHFLDLVTQSGNSSWKWLQNCYAPHNPGEQGITLCLALTEYFVNQNGGNGAYRVHGGGFAGTIQAFLPHELLGDYIALIEGVFGQGAVTVLNIRPYGTLCINSMI